MANTMSNYYALTIAIITNCLPEYAFARLNGKYINKIRLLDLSETDLNVIQSMRYDDKLSYREIGELYGVGAGAVYNIIRRIEERV